MSIPLVLSFGAWLWRHFIPERNTALRNENLGAFRAMDDVLQSVCLHIGYRELTDPLKSAWQALLMVQLMVSNGVTSWCDEVASQYVVSHENQEAMLRPIYAIHGIPQKQLVHEQLKRFNSLLVLAVEHFDEMPEDLALYITNCFDSVEDILSVLEHRS